MSITTDDLEKIKDTSINSKLLYAIATGDTSELDDIEVNTINAMLLKYIAVHGGSGGGTGGTTDYTALVNKPSINGIKLNGDKSLSDLGIDLSKYINSIDLVDAVPTSKAGTSTKLEKCLRLTYADSSTVIYVSVNDLINIYDDTAIKQDISDLKNNKVDKVTGKSLVDDTEIERLSNVYNYDDSALKASINTVANGLMASAGYSTDYKKIEIVTKAGDKKEIDVAPIIEHANITGLADVDSTDQGNGKTLVYDSASGKHKYVDSTGTDELVKMDSTGDSKYLSELIDKSTIVDESSKLKAKTLDGLEASITELNYVKGLTMPVQDLITLFANGGLKTLDTPFATYADLQAYDVSTLLDGISYLVRVLDDETRDNKITAYMIKKDQTSPVFYGYLNDSRDFTTNPISLVNEITGKLKAANIDTDDLFKLLPLLDTYKTLTTDNQIFSTHGAKAMYDELVGEIGNKANSDAIDNHVNDTTVHITADERTTWNGKEDKSNKTTTLDSNSTDDQYPSALSVFNLLKTIYPVGSIYINTTDVNPSTIFGFGTWERVAHNMTLWGASTSGEAGIIKTAGLPNITGIFGACVPTGHTNYASGAFAGTSMLTNSGSTTNGGVNPDVYGYSIDASRSSSVYGNSTTVQPPALVVNIWKRTA